MFCWMHKTVSPKHVDRVKQLTASSVMADAVMQKMPLRALFEGLIDSAANALASGVVLDGHNKVMCSMDDDAHIDAACQRFREAATKALIDARRDLLQPVLSAN